MSLVVDAASPIALAERADPRREAVLALLGKGAQVTAEVDYLQLVGRGAQHTADEVIGADELSLSQRTDSLLLSRLKQVGGPQMPVSRPRSAQLHRSQHQAGYGKRQRDVGKQLAWKESVDAGRQLRHLCA